MKTIHKALLHNFVLISISVLISSAIPFALHAQNISYQNPKMMQIAKPTSKLGWIDLRSEASVSPLTIFIDYKDAFGLLQNDDMLLVKTEADNLGYSHYRYQQFNKGIKIDGAEYIVHVNNNGVTYCANGKMITGLNSDGTASLNESDALQKAKIATGAKGFLWENAAAEKNLQQRKKTSTATYFPKGELVWSKPGSAEEMEAGNLVLCWKFDINTDGSAPSLRVYVDAKTGEVIRQLPLELDCNTGSGVTTFNGTQTIYTSMDGSDYILDYDCSNYSEIHVYDANYSQTTNYATEYTDANNTWTTMYQQMGVQTLFSIRAALKMYKDLYNRDGYDNSNSTVDAYNNSLFKDANGNLYGSNASWSQSQEIMRVGSGSNNNLATDDLNTIDILGHELTHAVTQYSAGLVYEKQSGALNESFSDIFGESCEKFTTGTNDWLCGGQRSVGAIRNFSNPNLKNQPKYYGDSLWVNTNCSPALANDYCGVHTNSGVQNFWFYLLSVGGSGTNHNGRAYSVSGIGIAKARDIAYRNLTVYLTSNSNYTDAREGAIHAAEDLYGSCSNEAIQCGNAWFACEVGTGLSDFNMTLCSSMPLQFGFFDEHYFGINSITSGGSGCAASVNPSTYSVNFHAKTLITLKPGFTAHAGCHFSAFIDACSVTNYKPADDNMQLSENALPNSEQRSMVSNSEFELNAFPNPFKNNLVLNLNLKASSKIIFNLYDVVGKELTEYSREENFGSGNNHFEIETSQLSSGVYFVLADDGSSQQKIKVTKLN